MPTRSAAYTMLFAGLVAGIAATGCRRADEAAPAATTPAARGIFSDRAAESGLDFAHFNGMTGELYFSEMMGSGAALFDYDNDGDLDLYLVQGHLLGRGKTLEDALYPPRDGSLPADRLYRNDLAAGDDGRPALRFTDVTAESGIEAVGYGMGVMTGDIDNDGWVDLYVTNVGANQMWRNNGPGGDGTVTFSDVTAETGTDDRRWSVPAVFFDYDRDGWLDLYVGNYVTFSVATHRECLMQTGAQTYCGPLSFPQVPDRLLRNRGPGAGGRVTFEEVTAASGLSAAWGAALGAVAADFDGDRWIDLFVANDGVANQLWVNQRDGTFRNRAVVAGVAVNEQGGPEAGMGVDAGDFDGDGDDDLFLAHLDRETNTVYVNDGSGHFVDDSIRTDLGMPSWDFTGFGTSWIDYDNDGWLDVLVVNGAITVLEALARAGDPYPLHQTNKLFRNLADGRFAEVTGQGGEAFARSEVSRGAAFGDVDNDGDTDVVVVNNSGPVRLLINDAGQDRHWIGLRLVGGTPERDMLGARVGITLPGGRVLWRRCGTDGSYASAGDPRVLAGLGDATAVTEVRVRWPDGREETWSDLAVDRYTTLRQGSGTPVG